MEIYAELNNNDLDKIDRGIFSGFSNNVKMFHKQGSRSCFFECDNEEGVRDVIDILESNGINWQYNEIEAKKKEEEKTDTDSLHYYGMKKEKEEKEDSLHYYGDKIKESGDSLHMFGKKEKKQKKVVKEDMWWDYENR